MNMNVIPKVPRSVEERLNELELLVPYLATLKDQSSLKDEVILLNQRVSAIDKRFSSLKEKFDSLVALLSDLQQAQKALQISHDARLSKVESEVAINLAKVSSLADRMNVLIQDCDRMRDKFKRIEEQSVKWISDDCHLDFRKHVDAKIMALQNALFDQRNSLNELSIKSDERMDYLSDNFLCAKEEMASCLMCFQSLKEDIADLSDKIQKSDQAALSSLQKLEKESKDYVNQRIFSIKIPEPGPSADQIRQIVHGEMESISLDAKNAIARSLNNDMRNSILEKKFDNILLVVKNFELSNRE